MQSYARKRQRKVSNINTFSPSLFDAFYLCLLFPLKSLSSSTRATRGLCYSVDEELNSGPHCDGPCESWQEGDRIYRKLVSNLTRHYSVTVTHTHTHTQSAFHVPTHTSTGKNIKDTLTFEFVFQCHSLPLLVVLKINTWYELEHVVNKPGAKSIVPHNECDLHNGKWINVIVKQTRKLHSQPQSIKQMLIKTALLNHRCYLPMCELESNTLKEMQMWLWTKNIKSWLLQEIRLFCSCPKN